MLLYLNKLMLASINLILVTTLAQQQTASINFIPEKVIIVNNSMFKNGSAQDNSITNCAQYSSMIYNCPSFQAALAIVENNTIINITTDAVLLQSIVHLKQLNNIAIVGQNKTVVECNDSGILNCSSCNNVTIRGITWNKCGTYMETGNNDFDLTIYHYYPGIIFRKCSNLFIQHCVFQNSTSSAIYLSEVSGIISINHAEFLFNGPSNFMQDMVNSLEYVAMGLTIIQPSSIQTTTKLNISITSCIFSHNSLALDRHGHTSVLLLDSSSISTDVNVLVSESAFILNNDLLPSKTYGVDTSISIVSIKIQRYLNVASIIFSEVTFESNKMQHSGPSSILDLFVVPKSFTHVYIQMTSCDFINNTAFKVVHFHKQANSDSFLRVVHDQGSGYDIMHYSTNVSFNNTFIDIINVIDRCTFNLNVASKSVLYITSNYDAVDYSDQFTIMNSSFEVNSETVIHVMNQHVTLKEMIEFRNNIAECGAAIYLDFGSSMSFDENSNVTFVNNFARRYGGAIFYDASQFSRACENEYISIQAKNNSAVNFNNNAAGIAGNSLYFSISQSCNISSLLDIVTGFNLSQSNGDSTTSPNELVFHSPAVLISSTNSITHYKLSGIMLGQAISIPACVFDYHKNPAGAVLFQVTRVDFNQNYFLVAPNFVSVSCGSLRTNNIHIIGEPPEAVGNSSVVIQFSSSYNSAINWKPIRVNLIVELLPCRAGYFYDDELKQCVCYETNDVVSCLDGNATIKRGYWFGMVNDIPTVGQCPINYCKYENCETATEICTLPSSLDEQCIPHRTGPACGNCVEGYSLSFDSVECVSTDKCSIGWTILVVIIMLIYWAVITVAVFGVMYFQVNIAYFYAITYFYSMLDVLFECTLHPSNHTAVLYALVAVMSGVAKLTPRFIGQLCFVQGMSGIDQQIIHYIHPLAIWLVIMVICILARFSRRMSGFLSRGIIRTICLLILLSFTSGASSTSLSIMRGFRYADIDDLYSYASPDIVYFQGRHLFYSIVAYLFVILIVVGLPVILFSEPFLNRKINFSRFKPLLDQFQGCYKDRLRWFASYYMICRQILLNIVFLGYDYFISLNGLLVACIIINLIHWLLRPYASKILNIYDGLVLQTIVSIIALQIIYIDNFDSVVPIAAAYILVMLPIIIFLVMALVLNAENIRKLYTSCLLALKPVKSKELYYNQNMIERKGSYDTTVDFELRERSTTVLDLPIKHKKSFEELDHVSFQESLLEVMTDEM